MAHVSKTDDILCESIRHELRIFAQDTFEAELMRVGDRVEQGLREELSEFLRVWADSEGKMSNRSEADDDVIKTLVPVTKDDQSHGWFKRVRKFPIPRDMISPRTSKKPADKRVEVTVSRSDDEGQATTHLSPPMLQNKQGKKGTDSHDMSIGLRRHPKGFAVGQEISDHSSGDRFKITDVGNGWSKPLGAAEQSQVRASPMADGVTSKSRPRSASDEEGPTIVRPFVAEPSMDRNSNETPYLSETAFGIMPSKASMPSKNSYSRDSVLDECLGSKRMSRHANSILDATDKSLIESVGDRKHKCRRMISDIVLDPKFDYLTGGLIILNSIVIGVQTDYMARHTDNDDVPVPFAVIERLFCVAFTLELCMRSAHHGRQFFYGPGWRWNIFDAIIVALQLLEELFYIIAKLTESDKQHGQQMESLSIMRTLRVLRLIRIIRLVRVLRLISELRTIVVSIIGSMRSLGWTIVLLVLMMYIIGVFLTQLVSQHMVEHGDRDEDGDGHPDLGLYYDNLGRSILTLFQSISGGVDWDDSVQPLMKNVSPWLALMFSFYIAFAVFALFNIVTGVFVESALATARSDQDILLMHNVRQLFTNTDVDSDGKITWDEFESQLDNEQMLMYFSAIDLDKEEARELFKLIDIDESGSIDPEEFLNGCFRLRGPSKALDLAVLMHETKRINTKWFAHARYVETSLSLLLRQAVPAQQRSPQNQLAVIGM